MRLAGNAAPEVRNFGDPDGLWISRTGTFSLTGPWKGLHMVMVQSIGKLTEYKPLILDIHPSVLGGYVLIASTQRSTKNRSSKTRCKRCRGMQFLVGLASSIPR